MHILINKYALTTRQTIPLGNTQPYFCMFAHNAFPFEKIEILKTPFYYCVFSNANSFCDTHKLNDEKHVCNNIIASAKEAFCFDALIAHK